MEISIFYKNRWILTYNGEIYNYIEIEKTQNVGYKFYTDTDTEVLILYGIIGGKMFK